MWQMSASFPMLSGVVGWVLTLLISNTLGHFYLGALILPQSPRRKFQAATTAGPTLPTAVVYRV